MAGKRAIKSKAGRGCQKYLFRHYDHITNYYYHNYPNVDSLSSSTKIHNTKVIIIKQRIEARRPN